MHDVYKKEIFQWLKGEFINAISNSLWVSLIHSVPRLEIIVKKNENGEELKMRERLS